MSTPAEELRAGEARGDGAAVAAASDGAVPAVSPIDQFRALAENAPDVISRFDRSLRYRYVNPAMITATGMTPEHVIGKTSTELQFPAHLVTLWESSLNRVFSTGQPYKLEFNYESWRGLRYYEARIVPEMAPDGTIVSALAISRDVTESKHVENALRESEGRFRVLTEEMPLVVWSVRPDGTLDYVNPRWTEFSGLDLDATRRCGWLALIHPDDATEARRLWGGATASERPAELELRLRGIDHNYRWFLCRIAPFQHGSGGILRWIGTATDIDERRQAEEALQRSSAVLDAVCSTTPDLLFVKDVEGRLLLANPSLLAFLGMSAAEAAASTTVDYMPPEFAEPIIEHDRQVIQTGTAHVFEERVRACDGSLHLYLTTKSPYRDADGNVVGVIGIAREITARKQMEEALREADQRKSDFLALLSHELRNPLAPIRSSLHVLALVPPGSEQARRALAVIDRQTNHMTSLIDDLLDVTRIERGKVQLHRQRVDLNQLVVQTVEDHASEFAKAGVSVAMDASEGSLWVNGDPTRLAQIVGNLLRNAVMFTTRGGHARVSLAREAPDDTAVIRVRDDGVGIEQSLLPHLFEPFKQGEKSLERSRGGLGLGLALVKGLVELHGGTVEAKSSGPGTGSEFAVHLPLTHLDAGTTIGTARTGHAKPTRILIIEDNVDAAQSLCEVLELEGHQVEVAHSGQAGLAAAECFRPEVVLCDIGLPQMDGYAVARALRADQRLCHLFLVALTGYASPEDIEKAAAAGFDRHLAKPPRFALVDEVLVESSKRPGRTSQGSEARTAEL